MKIDSGYRKKLGTWGENYAHDYLVSKGYEPVCKNYHSKYGELDLIMKLNGNFVAVEVKTRRSNTYGIAEFSITRKKFHAIQATMNVFLDHLEQPLPDWQIDLVIIEVKGKEPPEIIHYENLYLGYLDD